MHKVKAPLNLPLALALFGGAVLVGGAILAYPESRPAPPRTEASAPLAKPPFQPGVSSSVASAPSLPLTATEPALPAPTGSGGGPAASSAFPDSDEDQIGAPPPGTPGPATGGEAPPARTAARAPSDTVANPSAPNTTAPNTTAPNATAPNATASASASASAGPIGRAGPAPSSDPNAPYMVPSFGMPTTMGSANQPPIVNTGGGGGGGGGGGSSSTSTSVPAQVTASMLIPLNDSARPETVWPSVSRFLEKGDLVLARITGDSTAATFMSWSERANTDAPLAAYGVAFDRPAQIDSVIASGVPAALGVLGLSRTDGVDDATLTRIAARVHGLNRKLFVSVEVPSTGPSFAAVGARADVVELVVSSANAAATVSAAKDAAKKIGAKPVLFVRVPEGLSTADAAAQITSGVPSAGVALRWSDDLAQVVGELRSTK